MYAHLKENLLVVSIIQSCHTMQIVNNSLDMFKTLNIQLKTRCNVMCKSKVENAGAH